MIKINVLKFKGSSVVGVSWSTKNSKLIFSMDESGNLVRWDITSDSTSLMNFGKSIVPTCMQVSPYADEIVAFGTKGGNIYIIKSIGEDF